MFTKKTNIDSNLFPPCYKFTPVAERHPWLNRSGEIAHVATLSCSILDNVDNPVGILDYVYSRPRIVQKPSRERRYNAGPASTSRRPPK